MFKRLRESFKPSGFESLMGLAIAGIIVGFAIYQFMGHLAHNRDNQRRHTVASIQEDVRLFYASHGYYPVTLSQLSNPPTATGYAYSAFRAGTEVSPNSTTNCNDRQIRCVNYVIYTNQMEKADNPYFVRSY